jgi:hypothetical protein
MNDGWRKMRALVGHSVHIWYIDCVYVLVWGDVFVYVHHEMVCGGDMCPVVYIFPFILQKLETITYFKGILAQIIVS